MGIHHFGRIITAMVTPFTSDGRLDLDGAQVLAEQLTGRYRNDGLVVNGTTGESSTTSDAEKADLVRAVVAATSPEVRVIAGVGTNDTRHSIALAKAAEAAGADGLLVVTPYYSKPSQSGILAHFRAIADSTELPIMLYDIPARSGVALDSETILEAGKHERIIAVKDAKGNLEASAWVMRESSLAYYAGDDALTLPLSSIGAVGVVSVVGHFCAERIRRIFDAQDRGDTVGALSEYRAILPVVRAVFRAPAAASVKCALRAVGMPAGPVRLPLVDLTVREEETFVRELTHFGALADDRIAHAVLN
jgi:4-hydroxy-tetrahydrodipicolinate synthase